MSMEAVTAVWKHSTHKGPKLLLMLAIADYAKDDGSGAYPSISKLAKKARMSERSTQYALAQLRDSGELVIRYEEGPGGTNFYDIAPQVMNGTPTVKPGVKKTARVKTVAPPRAENCTPPVQTVAPPPVQTVAPNTSVLNINHTSKQTSRGTASAAPPPIPSKPVSPEPKKPTSRQRQEPPEETAYYAACVPIVARLCRIDLAIPGEWARCKKPLQALYHATIRPTPDLLAMHYETPTGYWYAHDFRGQKGDTPEPHWIQNTWGKATSTAPPLKVVNGNGHAHPRAAPQPDGIAAFRARLRGDTPPPEPGVIDGRVIHGKP